LILYSKHNQQLKKNNQIHIVTLGCSKNLDDSEVLMHRLISGGFEVTHNSENIRGGTVIINTCGFIDDAKEESIETILSFANARKSNQIERLFVMGCLSQRYKKQLIEEIHEVDKFFGVNDLDNILTIFNTGFDINLIGEKAIATPGHYAYLKISEGCDRTCSFCAIPLIRGKHISKPIEAIVKEARFLASNGVKELMLIAQDLTYYGLDIYKQRKLAELLNQLIIVDGIEWIRLHYAYPAGFPEDIIDVMKSSGKVCKYLDIPLQHISDRILQSMRRGHSADDAKRLIEKLRKSIPGIALRTTLIAGYPGETDKEFNQLKAFIEEYRFERLGVFAYSHEEDTHAFRLEDNVSEEKKHERVSELMELQERISLSHNEQKIGEVMKIIIDRREGDFWVGRTMFDSPEIDNETLVKTSEKLTPGVFLNVRITQALPFDLIAEPV
jgi:ribosomal protein S12 methylthiotransferase